MGKSIQLSLLLLGLLLFVFFCVSVERIIGICILTGLLFVIYKLCKNHSFGYKFLCYVEKKGWLFLLLIILLGIIERILIFKISPFALGDQQTDYGILWNAAKLFSEGEWTLSKSWTTVFMFGLSCKLLGTNPEVAWITAGFLQITTCIIMFYLVRTISNGLGGLIACTLYFLSPVFAIDVFHVATEHTYALFLVCALFALLKKKVILAMIFSLFAMWSRAEGILLVVLIPIWTLLDAIYNRNNHKDFIRKELLLFLVITTGALFATTLNKQMGQSSSMFCSNDNWWPRLMGSNVETGGAFSGDDCVMIWQRYHSLHPEVDWEMSPDGRLPLKMCGQCPKEVIPLIKEEIINRWSNMSVKTFFSHIMSKEIIDWNTNSIHFNTERGYGFLAVAAFALIFPCIIIIGGFLFLVTMMQHLFKHGRLKIEHLWVCIIIPFLLGNWLLLCIVECMPRYGFALHLLGTIIASLGFIEAIKQLQNRISGQ